MNLLDFDHSLAIVIGIDQYNHGISPLRTAVADAKAISHLLQQKHNYQVISLLDEQAQLASLQTLIQDTLPSLVSSNSRLLLYFAGHGIAQNGDDGPTGYLIPQDATPRNIESYLPMVALHDALTALPCRHFLAIFDCCFAGAFRWSSTRKATIVSDVIHQERYDRFRQDPAWQVITSASYNQEAIDILSLQDNRGVIDQNHTRHSPFASALMQALQGAADTSPPATSGKPAGDGVMTATELYLYLRDSVEVLTVGERMRQTPEICTLRKHDKGEYIFLTPGHELNLPPAPELDIESNPYRGLESFGQVHGDLFFGRDHEIEQLLKKIEQPHPLTVVLGASGTGKSSLVKAGLLPRLTSQPEYQILPVIRPGNYPLAALARASEDIVLKSEINTLSHQFETDENAFCHLIDRWQQTHPGQKVLLVIDQTEELITQSLIESESIQFQRLLKRAMAKHWSALHVVATLRLDFEAQFQDAEMSEEWMNSRFVVSPMTQAQLREAIEQPAAQRVLYFEPYSLVDTLVEDVAQTPGALPLLSFTLSELYLRYLESNHDNRALSAADYRALGGVAGALTRRATEEYEALVAEDTAYEKTIKHVMLRMVSVEGGELASRRAPMSELVYTERIENERVQKLLQKMIAARLVVRGQEGASEPYVEPAHDALVRGWDKLLRWKNEKQEDLILQRKLTSQSKDWELSRQTESLSKARGFLWDDNPRLELLTKAAAANRHWLNKLETTFVDTSVKKKNTLRRRRVTAVITVVSLLSGLTFTALTAAIRAVGRQMEAYSAASEANLLSNQELEALVSGLQAGKSLRHPLFRLWNPSSQLVEKTKGTLYKAIYSVRENNRLAAHRHDVYQLSYSPDGKQLVTVGDDDALRLWTADGLLLDESLQHRQINAELVEAGEPLFVPAVDFGADGKTIATGDSNGNVILWKIKNNKLVPVQTVIHTQSENKRIVRYVAFSPTGEQLATGGNDGSLRLWNISERPTADAGDAIAELSAELPRNPGNIWGIDYSSDGETLAIARGSFKESGLEGITYLWNAKDFNDAKTQPFAQCKGHTGSVRNVKFHPHNGNKLVTTGQDTKVSLWEIKPDNQDSVCQQVKTLEGHNSQVWGIDFSPSGQHLVTVGENAILWDEEGNKETVIKGHKDGLWSVRFNPAHEHLLATAGEDGTVRLWDLSDKFRKLALDIDTRVRDIDFSQTGNLIAVGGSDGTVRLWNWPQNWQEIAQTPKDLSERTCKGHQGTAYGVSLSPDGNLLAAAVNDSKLYLWDVTNDACRIRGSWLANNETVQSVEFHPENNRVLATAGQDGSIRLWDLENVEQWQDGRPPLPAFQGHRGEASDVSFNYDGTWLATVGTDAAVRVWNVAHLFEQMALLGSSNDSPIARESLAPQSLLADCRGNQQWLLDSDFHPTQNLLVSSDSGGTVILWDLTEVEKKGCQEVWAITAHRESVYSVDFSPDGAMVAVGDRDGSARLWDLEGNPVGEFPGHTDRIWSAEFSPDGQTLVTSDNSYTLRAWPIEDFDSLMSRGCRWAYDYINSNEYSDLCR